MCTFSNLKWHVLKWHCEAIRDVFIVLVTFSVEPKCQTKTNKLFFCWMTLFQIARSRLLRLALPSIIQVLCVIYK